MPSSGPMPPADPAPADPTVAQLQRELAAARERLRHLEELDRIHMDFVLAVSHELRTPLTLISGYAQQLLLRWATTGEARRHAMVEKINISSHRLSRLIDDILLIANVESGDLSLHIKSVALAGIVAQALNELCDRYPGGLPTVTVAGADAQVVADGFRLEQVLICLLDNAVKHAPPHSTVGVTCQRHGANVVIGVSDQGGGIDAADMARLFTRFGRVERTIGQSHGGVGLGLYVARQLTEAMGGEIRVESERGAGSTFYVSVPAAD